MTLCKCPKPRSGSKARAPSLIRRTRPGPGLSLQVKPERRPENSQAQAHVAGVPRPQRWYVKAGVINR